MKFGWLFSAVFIIAIAGVFSSSCIFSPDKGTETNEPDTGTFQKPIKALTVIENLKVSFSHLEPDWYEQCLNENFFYEVPSKTDELDVRWPRSDDIRIIRNMFADCTAFVFTGSEISSYKEWGQNIPDIPNGAEVSLEHPDDIWYVYNYTIDMDIFTRSYGNFKVHQDMQFKMVKDPDTGYYSIIRWIDITPD